MLRPVCLLIGALVLLAGCSAPAHVKDLTYGDLAIRVESPGREYDPGETAEVRIFVTNNGTVPFSFDTARTPLQEPFTRVGVEQNRPAADLLFVGSAPTGDGDRPITWSWSRAQGGGASTITLAPGQTQEVLSARWSLPDEAGLRGSFRGRFADLEFATGVSVRLPRR